MKRSIEVVLILVLFLSCNIIFAQNKTDFTKNNKIQHYLIRDSLASYIIKEVIHSDGSKSYSFIPKSHIEGSDIVKENYPQTLIDWFNKEKRNGRIIGAADIDSRRKGIIDTVGAYKEKKDRTVWWILGATVVIGGITAYYFLQVKDVLEELPIQPDPPKQTVK